MQLRILRRQRHSAATTAQPASSSQPSATIAAFCRCNLTLLSAAIVFIVLSNSSTSIAVQIAFDSDDSGAEEEQQSQIEDWPQRTQTATDEADIRYAQVCPVRVALRCRWTEHRHQRQQTQCRHGCTCPAFLSRYITRDKKSGDEAVDWLVKAKVNSLGQQYQRHWRTDQRKYFNRNDVPLLTTNGNRSTALIFPYKSTAADVNVRFAAFDYDSEALVRNYDRIAKTDWFPIDLLAATNPMEVHTTILSWEYKKIGRKRGKWCSYENKTTDPQMKHWYCKNIRYWVDLQYRLTSWNPRLRSPPGC